MLEIIGFATSRGSIMHLKVNYQPPVTFANNTIVFVLSKIEMQHVEA